LRPSNPPGSVAALHPTILKISPIAAFNAATR
jgi:hypothetical protein